MKAFRDIHGIKVKEGDSIKGISSSMFSPPALVCQGGFKINLSPVVTVRKHNNRLYGGGVSMESFRNFEILNKH